MIEYKQKAKFTRGNKKPTDYPILMVWDGRLTHSLSLSRFQITKIRKGRRKQKTWLTGMEERDEEKGIFTVLSSSQWRQMASASFLIFYASLTLSGL